MFNLTFKSILMMASTWWLNTLKWVKQELRWDPKEFPPRLTWLRRIILLLIYIVAAGGFFIVWSQFWPSEEYNLPSSTFYAYAGFAGMLTGLVLDRYIRHRFIVHKDRLEDPSEVHALIEEAHRVEPRLLTPERRPKNYSLIRGLLNKEITRLTDTLDINGWTEFEILPLDQMLVDFYKLDDLKTNAHWNLDALKDYAEDSAYRLDQDVYLRWEERIERAIKAIDDIKRPPKGNSEIQKKKDTAAEALRAELRNLLYDLAGRKAYWSEGSVVVRSLMISGAVAIPTLLIMGLIPILHPTGPNPIGIINWGLLGTSGSLTGVLLSLFKSDLVEVGNTEGRKELWRAILGSVLGFVAGVLIFSIISGGLLTSGTAVPDIAMMNPMNVGLSVLWAVASGYSFEKIIERMRSTTDFGK